MSSSRHQRPVWIAAAAAIVAAVAAAGFVVVGPVFADRTSRTVTAWAVSPEQPVQVKFAGGSVAPATFASKLTAYDDGGAQGQARLEYKQSTALGVIQRVTLDITFVAATVTRSDDAAVIEFRAKGRKCIAGVLCQNTLITGAVRTTSSPDCLIYDLVGPAVRDGGARIDAQGTLVVR